MTAAIQAARAGADTLLVEKNGILGGTITIAGISAPAHFFAWGRQIIGGIGWELVKKTLEETGRPVPGPESTRGKKRLKHNVKINEAIFAALCDEVAVEAGTDLLFHAMPAKIAYESDRWQVDICTKSGLQRTTARVLIDATGDANAVALAGFELERPEIIQPATLSMQCSGYDEDELDYAALESAARQAVEAGELKSTDIAWGGVSPERFLRSHGRNANHFRAPSAETSPGRTAAELEGRRSMLRMYRFFRKQPGLENFRINSLAMEAGIRETVMIKGKKTMTVEDYESGRFYDDAVCYAYYPIDEHKSDGQKSNYRLLEENVLPTVPRGALLPADSRFLLVAGRCLASDHETNSAVRVECPCMAMGQAAGAMAAISAAENIDPEELPMERIYSLLREHGAVVPGDINLPG